MEILLFSLVYLSNIHVLENTNVQVDGMTSPPPPYTHTHKARPMMYDAVNLAHISSECIVIIIIIKGKYLQ